MSTVSDTPSKRGVTGVVHPTVPNITPRLPEDMEGKYSYDVTILDFVTHVWGIDPAIAGYILSMTSWTFLQEPLQVYSLASWEPEMYAPYAEIAESLVSDATKKVSAFLAQADSAVEGQLTADTLIHFWIASGLKILNSPLTKRRPDMLAINKDVVHDTSTWLLARQAIDFKQRSEARQETALTASWSSSAYPPSLNPVSMGRSSITGSSASFRVPQILSKTRSVSGMKHSRTSNASTSSASSAAPRRSTRLKSVSTTTTASTGGGSVDPVPSTASQKRQHSGTQEDSVAKRARTLRKVPDITGDQPQLAFYALECLDASTRHYVSGVFFDKFKVALWYYDRSCIISTVTFDFRNNPEQLALVFYALNVCGNKHAGFDPHLLFSPTRSTPPEDHSHWQNVAGSEIRLPVSNAHPGRGKFRVEDTLFMYYGLIGRGTMVYQVVPHAEGAEDHDSEALKINWPLLTRPLEVDMIHCLQERLPAQWHEHIPEVTFPATQTAEELNLLRVELLKTNPIEKLEDRQMHALAMKLHGKLWKVGSVEAFQEVFIDCVECHYHAYVDAKVLHGDLSENNLMFRLGDGDEVKGILNDWDMASYVGANNEIQLSTTKHRTGTIPFMAQDLLVDDNPPPHLYRHDLESFFYILVWVALHYDFSRKKRCPINPLVSPWVDTSMENTFNAKYVFISDETKRDRVFRGIRPECQPLLPWLDSLGKLFHRGHMSWQKRHHSPRWDNTTHGGHITFKKFMAALGRAPR